MKVLASRIVEGLKTADHFAVYESELKQFWPAEANNREVKIQNFARQHGLRLRFSRQDCVRFSTGSSQNAFLPTARRPIVLSFNRCPPSPGARKSAQRPAETSDA